MLKEFIINKFSENYRKENPPKIYTFLSAEKMKLYKNCKYIIFL